MKYCPVLLLLFVIGCSVEPKVSDGPLGSISGKAILYSSVGATLSSNAGVTVTIASTGKSALTNDSGKWTISGLAAGSYDLTFSKQGFGTSKDFSFQTTGKDTNFDDEIEMCQPPEDVINFQRIDISLSPLDSTPSYNIIVAMEPPFLVSRSVVLFISTDSVALANNLESASVLLSFAKAGSGYDGGFSWSSTTALAAGNKSFAHGTKLYATVSISGEGPNGEYLSNYFDPILGKQVYTALGKHSQILSMVMP